VQNRENRKAAAPNRGTAVLSCTAQGAPNITFTWRRQAGELATTTTNKYDISSRRLDPLTWQSRFTVRDVNSADYGGYECLARSAEGAARAAVVALVEPSRPDTPAAFRVLNTTADAVSLAWRPGFNGGSDQIYRVEYYRKQEGSLYAQPSYYDVYPMNATSTVIMGLSPATRYAFSIQALNDLGESDFTFPTLEVVTLTGGGGGGGGSVQANQPLVDELTDTASQSVPLIVTISVGVCGTLLLILSVVLVSCLLHKRRQKQQKKGGGSGNSSSSTTTSRSLASEASGKSGVVGAGGDGMLLFNGSQGTSCYNDTMSEETMSSISEKSGGSFISPPGEGRISNGGGLIVVSTAYLHIFISKFKDELCTGYLRSCFIMLTG
jgi:hypothetical protein